MFWLAIFDPELLLILSRDTLERIEATTKENRAIIEETKKDISELGDSLAKASQAHEQAFGDVKDALQETRISNLSKRKLVDICAGLRTGITHMQQPLTSQAHGFRLVASMTFPSHERMYGYVAGSVFQVARIYYSQTRRLINRVSNQ